MPWYLDQWNEFLALQPWLAMGLVWAVVIVLSVAAAVPTSRGLALIDGTTVRATSAQRDGGWAQVPQPEEGDPR